MYPERLPDVTQPTTVRHPHEIAARGFAQMFGLHPAIAGVTLIVDAMLFGSDMAGIVGSVFTFGLSLAGALVLSGVAGAIVGYVTYKAQQKWYGDDEESARIKAIIIAILIAIPTPIPAFFYVPAGILGFFRPKN